MFYKFASTPSLIVTLFKTVTIKTKEPLVFPLRKEHHLELPSMGTYTMFMLALFAFIVVAEARYSESQGCWVES